jgi:hypothetical protein
VSHAVAGYLCFGTRGMTFSPMRNHNNAASRRLNPDKCPVDGDGKDSSGETSVTD